MPKDYFPANDRALRDWLTNFVANLTINAAAVGLLPADLVKITGDADEFAGRLTTYDEQKALLASASGAKKTARTEVIATLRPLVQRIQNHPGMNDQLRGLLGLPLRNNELRIAGAMPPDIPKMHLETKPGKVWVHFGTEPGNERQNGKPLGVKGCNIWRKKGDEPTYQLVAFQSASPYEDSVAGLAADYTYVVQYRGNKASDLGEWSVPGTIAARGALVEDEAA